MARISSKEVNARALELREPGTTQKQICQDLRISKSELRSWMDEPRLHHHGFKPAEGVGGKAEQARMLKREQEIRTTRSCGKLRPSSP